MYHNINIYHNYSSFTVIRYYTADFHLNLYFYVCEQRNDVQTEIRFYLSGIIIVTSQMVIKEIGDESVARAVRSAQHTEANALYAFMMTLGKMPGRIRNARQANCNTTGHMELTHRADTTDKKDSNRKIVCNNCNKIGHLKIVYWRLSGFTFIKCYKVSTYFNISNNYVSRFYVFSLCLSISLFSKQNNCFPV